MPNANTRAHAGAECTCDHEAPDIITNAKAYTSFMDIMPVPEAQRFQGVDVTGRGASWNLWAAEEHGGAPPSLHAHRCG